MNIVETTRQIIDGHSNYIKSKLGKLEKHIEEQALERALKCTECVENGSCVHCGCKSPQLFYSVYKKCPQNKWDIMMNKEE